MGMVFAKGALAVGGCCLLDEAQRATSACPCSAISAKPLGPLRDAMNIPCHTHPAQPHGAARLPPPQAQRQSQLEHLVGAKRLEDRVASILQRVERELDDAGGWVAVGGWGGWGRWLEGRPGGLCLS